MNFYSHSNYYSDPFVQFSPEQYYSQLPESSDGSTAAAAEEEMTLASENPKKRAGRKKFRETRHPVYRGVRRRDSGKWVCEVREPGTQTRIWLGTFPVPEMAARAHDVAAIAFKGRSACLNFADSAWRLPVPESADAKDIQKASAEAAEMFRPTTSSETESHCPNNQINDDQDQNIANNGGETEWTSYDQWDHQEAVYGMGMPGLLESMAQGLMLPPPQCGYGDEAETAVDMNLWSYHVEGELYH